MTILRQSATQDCPGTVEAIDNTQQSSRNSYNWLVVTDLDGTLLDHHTYSYQPAIQALNKLGALGIPVILCSSKTRIEMVQIREQLGSRDPFVVENGAAICEAPSNSGARSAIKSNSSGDGGDIVLGRAYEDIIRLLEGIREKEGFKFRGFSDMTAQEVADATGLSIESAALAKSREYSEPLIWQDSDENRQLFLQQLSNLKLGAQQGGRFLTVSGLTDKGRAVSVLRDVYSQGSPPKVIALGDSPNDQAMLDSADIAVIVKSNNADKLVVKKPTKIIYTQEPGPTGWNKAILDILEDEIHG